MRQAEGGLEHRARHVVPLARGPFDLLPVEIQLLSGAQALDLLTRHVEQHLTLLDPGHGCRHTLAHFLERQHGGLTMLGNPQYHAAIVVEFDDFTVEALDQHILAERLAHHARLGEYALAAFTRHPVALVELEPQPIGHAVQVVGGKALIDQGLNATVEIAGDLVERQLTGQIVTHLLEGWLIQPRDLDQMQTAAGFHDAGDLPGRERKGGIVEGIAEETATDHTEIATLLRGRGIVGVLERQGLEVIALGQTLANGFQPLHGFFSRAFAVVAGHDVGNAPIGVTTAVLPLLPQRLLVHLDLAGHLLTIYDHVLQTHLFRSLVIVAMLLVVGEQLLLADLHRLVERIGVQRMVAEAAHLRLQCRQGFSLAVEHEVTDGQTLLQLLPLEIDAQRSTE